MEILATKVRHFGPTYSKTIWKKMKNKKKSLIVILKNTFDRLSNSLPKMYIMAKQVSYAIPTKNRVRVNCQKLFVNAVAIPAMHALKLARTIAGIRP